MSPREALALSEVLAAAGDEPGLGGEWFDRDALVYTAYVVGEPSESLVRAAAVRDTLRVKFAKASATGAEMEDEGSGGRRWSAAYLGSA